MKRALTILLGIVAITWLEYAVFPGHSWLQSDTQIYAPQLEHLASPGLLSRDLVATHPDMAYTIYDEVTLFLQEAGHLHLHAALLWQQILFRAAGILGVFLIAISAGIGDTLALLTAALVNAGAMVYGPGIGVIDLEPTPRGFAFGLVLLATGLLAHGLPLLGGLAGGLALAYDPRVAFPFWAVILVAMLFERSLRPMLRPSITILAIFGLLLANLAQLQPGVADAHAAFDKLSPEMAKILRYRTSYVWVSSWAPRLIWMYLALWAIGLWATSKLWRSLGPVVRWFLLGMPALGLCGVLLSYTLFEWAGWRAIPELQPAQALMFVLAFASMACVTAGLRAMQSGNKGEALFLVAACLALTSPHPAKQESTEEVEKIAAWAETNTWGGSMFLFPDAQRARYPGVFRTVAKRAVWVDWETGKQSDYFDSFADEWSRRWRDTMEGDYSVSRLKSFLPLPIDYYIVKRGDLVPGALPAFSTADFLVYDAQELRDLPN